MHLKQFLRSTCASIRALAGAIYDGLRSPLATCNPVIAVIVLTIEYYMRRKDSNKKINTYWKRWCFSSRISTTGDQTYFRWLFIFKLKTVSHTCFNWKQSYVTISIANDVYLIFVHQICGDDIEHNDEFAGDVVDSKAVGVIDDI